MVGAELEINTDVKEGILLRMRAAFHLNQHDPKPLEQVPISILLLLARAPCKLVDLVASLVNFIFFTAGKEAKFPVRFEDFILQTRGEKDS